MKTVLPALILAMTLVNSESKAQNISQYESLRRVFQQANQPATVEDFEQGAWDHCLMADIQNPYAGRPTRVRTVRMQVPPQGPALPGGLEVRADVYGDRNIDQQLPSFIHSSAIFPSPEYFFQVVDGPGWPRMNLYAKRTEAFMVFHVAVSGFAGPMAPMNPQAYGYCWNERQSPPPAGRPRSPQAEVSPEPQTDVSPMPPVQAPAPAPASLPAAPPLTPKGAKGPKSAAPQGKVLAPPMGAKPASKPVPAKVAPAPAIPPVAAPATAPKPEVKPEAPKPAAPKPPKVSAVPPVPPPVPAVNNEPLPLPVPPGAPTTAQ